MSLSRFVPHTALVALALALGADGTTASAQAPVPQPCPIDARCGTVTVPLDRSDPATGTTEIAYMLLSRTDTSQPALGTIVANPGGPGNATIDFAPYTSGFAPLRDRRDILLIDMRGTGRSEALSCPSLAARDPLTVDKRAIGSLCAGDLGPHAGLYGSAAAADDMEAVRAALDVDDLDLWGDSYGTYLMTVYAARHPEHVRSIVLDGAFPVASDPWGRDVLHGFRRVVGLVCARSGRCSGPNVLAGVRRLARRLRTHPRTFTAHSPLGRIRLTLGESELAAVAFGGGHPEVYGLLPAAVDAALHGDDALLERLVFASRAGDVAGLTVDPRQFSVAAASATSCHDYLRPYDLAATPAQRRRQYRDALAALDRSQFSPFSAPAWLSTGIDAGPQCLDWPADPTAGSPLRGLQLPDVPVLVQSGDLDTNTPIEQGRAAAAQFPHATFAAVANIGHTPDTGACGLNMARDFVAHLTVDPDRCRHNGQPPTVIDRPARRVAALSDLSPGPATPVRRAVGVALATLADANAAATVTGLTGTLDALRGGTYDIQGTRVRFASARVVRGAVVDGTQDSGRSDLHVTGRAVPDARLALERIGGWIHVTGKVGARHVALRVPAP